MISQKTTGKTTTSLNMQTNKLAQLIQAAAQIQPQENQWISKQYQEKMKMIMETNEKYNELKNSNSNENSQAT